MKSRIILAAILLLSCVLGLMACGESAKGGDEGPMATASRPDTPAPVTAYVSIRTDHGTPITGNVTLSGRQNQTLALDANGDSSQIQLSPGAQGLAFTDVTLPNGNPVPGGTYTWNPEPGAEHIDFTLVVPEAAATTFSSSNPGVMVEPNIVETWTWNAWGDANSFGDFDANVSVLATQVTQQAVSDAKGWGLSPSGMVVVMHLDTAVTLPADAGIRFVLYPWAGTPLGENLEVGTNASMSDAQADWVEEGDGAFVMRLTGQIPAGWSYFHIRSADPSMAGSSPISARHLSEAVFAQTSQSTGTCEPPTPTGWDPPPTSPDCDSEATSTTSWASCKKGNKLVCAPPNASVTEQESFTVSGNLSVGFSEGVRATFGIAITRSFSITVSNCHCERGYWCEKGSKSTWTREHIDQGGWFESRHSETCREDGAYLPQTCSFACDEGDEAVPANH